MSLFRRSVIITLLSNNVFAAVQFGITLVLARILSPAEIGIFSITVMVTGIASTFRDFGASAYLQREKELTPEKMRSALGFMLATSWVTAAAIFLFSNPAAAFYNEPAIGSVMRVLSLTFILIPFASYYHAILARNMEAAGKQAIVNGVGTMTYAVSCLSLAWLGFSSLAPAWSGVFNIAATIITYASISTLRIPFVPSFRRWGRLVHFGGGALTGALLDRLSAALPDLVLGKYRGPYDVGIYSRAGGLVGIFTQIAGPSLHYSSAPYLARAHHEGKSLAPILDKATSYLTVVSWPIFICILAFPREIITVLYGRQWVEAAPIAIVLAAVAIFRTSFGLTGWAMTAVGHPYLSATIPLTNVLARILMIAVVGANDLVSFAVAIAIADLVSLIIPIWLMSKHLRYTVGATVKTHWESLMVCLPCICTAVLLKVFLPASWTNEVKICILTPAIIVSWLLGNILFNHPIRQEFTAIFHRVLPPAWASRALKLFPSH